jgi:hypothetical protein
MLEKGHAAGQRESTTAPRNSQKHFKPTRRRMFRGRYNVLRSLNIFHWLLKATVWVWISMLCSTVVLWRHIWVHESKDENSAQQVESPASWLPYAQILHARTSATSRSHQHITNPRATNATCGNIHTFSILLPHKKRQLQYFHWAGCRMRFKIQVLNLSK